MNVTLTPEGYTLDSKWRLVPVDATDADIHAAYRSALGQSIRERDMPEIRKFAHAAIKAAPPPPQQSPWQPIATAPKDGTHVLLSYPGRITYGYWLVLEVGKLVGDCGGACRCPEYDEAPDPFWYSEDGGFTEEYPPTHWMPLPEPAP